MNYRRVLLRIAEVMLVVLLVGLHEEPTATPLPTATMSAPQSIAPTYRTHLKKVHEVLSKAFIGTNTNEYIVIGQLNFWYYGPGEFGGFEDSNGNRITPLTPLLGETYWAGDPSVVYQQIEWAVEYGVDAFSIEWTTPCGVGCCGSMEDTLDNVFLKSPNIHKIRWAIFYDFVLRLDQTQGLNIDMMQNIDFDLPDVYNTFVSDFVHFAKKYFGHPQYLSIDGRPVIYIWATNSYIGDLAGAIKEARNKVSEIGFDVFIVGDEVCVGCFDQQHAALFDGSSTFTFLIPGLDTSSWADVGDAATAVDGAFQWWRTHIAGLKVAGREEFVNFQPAWAPQYDERLSRPEHPIYVPATSKDQVLAMAMVARKHAQPVGSTGQKLVWLNTWNCWGETTTVEPTANLGPKYPAGNYQFDMLEVVREVFGSETFYISPLPFGDGDVAPLGNKDGIVNVGDALIALRFALGLEIPTQEDTHHGDVAPLNAQGQPSPDGAINVGDALVILRKALGLISF